MAEKTLPEQIADSLRRDILRGKLVPGAQVKERDSATELGVSRTPMREAIRILALEGLIELRPARSPIVAKPDLKAIADDIEVLLAVEQLSAQLACERATQEDLDRIGAINQRMTKEFDTGDPLDSFEIDMSFHSAIAQASHNAELAQIHRTYLARLWRTRFLAAVKRRNRERVVAHHTAILDGLRNGDVAATRRAINAHLDGLPHDIAEVIQSERGEDLPRAPKRAAAAPDEAEPFRRPGLVDK